ncbi:MAG: HEAT repeat domain-containing protein [Planctomycetota bacterium]|nr:HEAT repeat domain-containing protein [Planctomycetota bacterium]
MREYLSDESKTVRIESAKGILEVGSPDEFLSLSVLLDAADIGVRVALAQMLREKKDDSVIGLLGRLSKDKAVSVRFAAAQSLGRIGTLRSAYALLGLLDKKHPELKEEIKRNLASRLGIKPSEVPEKETMMLRWRGLVVKEYKDVTSIAKLGEDSYSIAVLSAICERVDLDVKLRAVAAAHLAKREPNHLLDYIEHFVKEGEKIDNGYGIDRLLALMSVDSLVAVGFENLSEHLESFLGICSDELFRRKIETVLQKR